MEIERASPWIRAFCSMGQVELDGVEQQIIGKGIQLRDRRDHGLAAGLINIPGVDAAGVDFSDGPGQRVLANAFGQFRAAFRRQFLGIVQSDDAAARVENDRGGHHGTEQRAATGFVESSDAHPATLSRVALVPCRAEPSHRRGF